MSAALTHDDRERELPALSYSELELGPELGLKPWSAQSWKLALTLKLWVFNFLLPPAPIFA